MRSFSTFILIVVSLSLSSVLSPHAAWAESKLRVAAAADLKFALPTLAKRFETQNPTVKVEMIFGSSGSLTQQIQAGAPFDVFLSADDSFPEKLKKTDLVEGDTFRYGTGHLVIWARTPLKLESLMKAGEPTLAILKSDAVKRFAIANPAVAPYGRIAAQALEKAHLDKELASKQVMAENVAQAAQFAATGAVSASLIAQALAESPEMKNAGTMLPLKSDEAESLKQSGAILKSSKLKTEAQRFRDLLLSNEGQSVLSAHGLGTKNETKGTK